MSKMKLNGSDEYCYRPETTLIVLADTIAKKHGLDPALVCALCEVESSWIPWAVRYEPKYRWLYNLQGGISVDVGLYEPEEATEAVQQKISWGLLQIMGAVARERGFRGWLTELCDPTVNLEWGCKHLRWMELNADSYGIELCADVSTVPTRLCGLPQSLAAAWNGGKARIVDGKYVNEDYVKRVVRAMVNYE